MYFLNWGLLSSRLIAIKNRYGQRYPYSHPHMSIIWKVFSSPPTPICRGTVFTCYHSDRADEESHAQWLTKLGNRNLSLSGWIGYPSFPCRRRPIGHAKASRTKQRTCWMLIPSVLEVRTGMKGNKVREVWQGSSAPREQRAAKGGWGAAGTRSSA